MSNRADVRCADNRNQVAVKYRAMPGLPPRLIHTPMQGRDEVSGNEFKYGRGEVSALCPVFCVS